jgi:hypothetical protein
VRVNGSVYSAYLNGSTNPITSLTNSTYASGNIGLYAYSTQSFQHLVVQSFPNYVQVFPTLTISNSSVSQVTLLWQTNATGYNLYSATNLSNVVWNPVTNVPTSSGGDFSVTLGATNAQQFFQLTP